MGLTTLGGLNDCRWSLLLKLDTWCQCHLVVVDFITVQLCLEKLSVLMFVK